MYKFILLLLVLISLNSFASNFEKLLDSKIVHAERIALSNLMENQFYFSMPFASEEILNPATSKLLQNRIIIKIELVYTRFRSETSFDQRKLNRNRLERLHKLAPQLFENPLWEFQLVEQTGSTTVEESNKMMHGFIFTYRPATTVQSFEEEINYLEALFSDDGDKDSFNNTIPPFTVRSRWDDTYGFVHDTIWGEGLDRPITPPPSFYNITLISDSIISKVLERNPSWKDVMIVTDATGSMSPYIKQVLSWLKLQEQNDKVLLFVFFNDGDKKRSDQKYPGETGGIYMMENKKFSHVLHTAIKCMKNGSGGGENFENDIEAILKGLEFNRSVKEALLIADNMESIRDYELMSLIDKPVRVILCGAENRINVQYLDLARATNGSLHTTKTDIFQLNKIKEKEIIVIDGKSYLFFNGKFQYLF